MGRGQVLRDKTEHCIVATRGRPIFHLTNQTTELRAPRRENSRKPDEFYALVEQLCPAPIYAELFSRGGRGRIGTATATRSASLLLQPFSTLQQRTR